MPGVFEIGICHRSIFSFGCLRRCQQFDREARNANKRLKRLEIQKRIAVALIRI